MQATTVAAQGTASSKFNTVTFSVNISEDGSSVPIAKAKLSESVELLNAAISDLTPELGIKITKNSLRNSSRTDENWEYVGNKRVMKGYTMQYTASFEITDLTKVSQVYDSLTNLRKIKVQAPVFGLKSKETLNKRALKTAFKKVDERFAMECQTLGLNKDEFEIASWETSYSDSQRSDRVTAHAMAGRPGAARMSLGDDAQVEGAIYSPQLDTKSLDAPQNPVIGFTVGLATVIVNLEVGYVRKTQTV